jgi:hypothetical protein
MIVLFIVVFVKTGLTGLTGLTGFSGSKVY